MSINFSTVVKYIQVWKVGRVWEELLRGGGGGRVGVMAHRGDHLREVDTDPTGISSLWCLTRCLADLAFTTPALRALDSAALRVGAKMSAS